MLLRSSARLYNGHEGELEDGGLLRFATFKDVQVPLDEGAEAEFLSNVQYLWVVAEIADRDTDFEDVYGVGRMRIVTRRIWTGCV